MMFVSPHWKYDPTRSLGPQAEGVCGMTADLPPELIVATMSAGQWWVYPIARSANVVFGVRLTPGVAMKHSAVVVAERSVASTIASRPAYFVPVHLYGLLGSIAARWDELAATTPKQWKALVALHHSLGGDDDLDELRKVLRDRRLKARSTTGDFRALYPVLLETQARLDPTPETFAYTSYVATVVATRSAPVPAPEAGCWNEALATLVLYIAEKESSDDDPRRAEAAWAARKIVGQLPGLDPHNNVVSSLSEPVAARIATTAAKIVTKARDRSGVDPRALPAIAEAARAKRYDGAAHLALAKTFEAARDHQAAFTALMTAAFWQAQRMAEVDPAILDRARKLARKARWIHLADALDEMREVRAELIREGVVA